VTPQAPLHARARCAYSPAERPPIGWREEAAAPQVRSARAAIFRSQYPTDSATTAPRSPPRSNRPNTADRAAVVRCRDG
jgi:hypothetical protein